MRVATCKVRKFENIAGFNSFSNTTGPVYNKNCLNSIAFHCPKSLISRGLLANSFDIKGLISRRNLKTFYIRCEVKHLALRGPLIHNFISFLTAPMHIKCM